jgi:acyl-coenzyme A synthetase/AMP-(fatty) acid ligase
MNLVAPAELESVLLTHPHVGDTAVIGVYREELATELPRAYVVPRGGLEALLAKSGEKGMREFRAEVEKWMTGQVANHKRLRGGVVLIDAIPKSYVLSHMPPARC